MHLGADMDRITFNLAIGQNLLIYILQTHIKRIKTTGARDLCILQGVEACCGSHTPCVKWVPQILGGKVTSMKLLTPSCAQLQNMRTYTICSPHALNVPTGTALPLCIILDFYEHSDRIFFSFFFLHSCHAS